MGVLYQHRYNLVATRTLVQFENGRCVLGLRIGEQRSQLRRIELE